MTNYPTLGFDPAPGAPDAVTALANNFSTVSQNLGSARDALNEIGQSDGIWQGDAANNFRSRVGELPGYLGKATSSLGDAAKALDSWAADLTTMQQLAAAYESQAEQALRKLQQAQNNPDLQLANQQFSDQQALQRAQNRLNAAEQQLRMAQQELNNIRDDAKRLLAQHKDMAGRIADALRRAKDEAPQEPGFWDSLGNAVGGLVGGITSLADKVWQWTKDHANVIAKVGDILGKVSGVLGVLALACAPIEPLGAILGAAAGITSVGALAAHGLAKAAGANVSWTSVGLDALGAVPFIGSVAKGAKVAQAGIDTATAVERAGSMAQDIGGGAKMVQIGRHAADGGVVRVVGGNFGSKLLVGGASKIMNGQAIGTKGFNVVAPVLSKVPGLGGLAGKAIDPLSSLGRGIDLGIGGAKEVGTTAYSVASGRNGT